MAVTVARGRPKRRSNVHYLMEDWPESMSMDEASFARYAESIEQQDFEDEIRNLSSCIRQLIEARRDTIEKLRASAEYLDSIWVRCRVSRSVGTTASLFGGGLTIAGGVLTIATMGAAAPVLIAGITTSSIGAATNIGTTVVEKILNSKQIKEMNTALNRDKDITLKIESMLDDIQKYKDSVHITALLQTMEKMLGHNHILVTILEGILLDNKSSNPPGIPSSSQHNSLTDSSGATKSPASEYSEDNCIHPDSLPVSSGVESTSNGVASTSNGVASLSNGVASTSHGVTSTPNGAAVISNGAEILGEGSGSESSSMCAVAGPSNYNNNNTSSLAEGKSPDEAVTALKEVNADMKYNLMDAGVFVEGGKVIGQNSFRLAGQLVIGISSAFLVWDAIDLSFTVSDLIKKKGSQAAFVLRKKADVLEAALEETEAKYNIDIPP